jgi:copper chaperone
MKKIFFIQNLKCGGCSNTIKKEIEQIEGVSNVIVNTDDDSVKLNSVNDVDLLIVERLNKLGYPVITEENTILKKAKSYVSCMIGRVS